MEYQIIIRPTEVSNGKRPCGGYIDDFNSLSQWFDRRREAGINSANLRIEGGTVTTAHGQYVLCKNRCVQSTIGYKGRVETLLANVEDVWMLEMWFNGHRTDRMYRYFFTVKDGDVYPEFAKDGIVACNLTFGLDTDMDYFIEEVKKTPNDILVIENL